MRKLPLFTFVNKMDRPALEPLELLDTIEKTLQVCMYIQYMCQVFVCACIYIYIYIYMHICIYMHVCVHI